METVKHLIKRLGKWEYSALCLLVLIILASHFSVIMQPNEPLFDEIHYVKDARVIISGAGTERHEHPALGKLMIVAGIKLFGDNPFGWRFFSVVFSVAGIIFFYLICRRLGLSKKISYLATFLFALENLSWVQGHIAMLDVFSVNLGLAAFWLYLKNRYVFSGAAIGLSALAKLNGALVILVIALHWFLTKGWPEIWKQLRYLLQFLRGQERWRSLSHFLTGSWEQWHFLLGMLVAPVIFIGLMAVFDQVIWRQWFDPILTTSFNPLAEIREIMKLTSQVTFASYEPDSIATRPWAWLLRPLILPYWYTPRYLGMISPTIWVFIMPLVVYIIYRAIRGQTSVLFPFSWFVGTYLVWIPASLVTNRASYIFYFYPTIGAICIGLAIVLFKLLDLARARQRGKLWWFIALVVPLYLLLHVYAFINIGPFSLGQAEYPYAGLSFPPGVIWWIIPLGLLLYIFTLFHLGIVSWRGFGDSLTPAEIPVDKPAGTVVE